MKKLEGTWLNFLERGTHFLRTISIILYIIFTSFVEAIFSVGKVIMRGFQLIWVFFSLIIFCCACKEDFTDNEESEYY